MRNPFNLQKSDAEFVEAARTQHGRLGQIAQLSIARSWTLITLVPLSLMLAFTPLFDDLNNVALNGMAFAAMVAGYAHLDLQIKFLKAMEADYKKTVQTEI